MRFFWQHFLPFMHEASLKMVTVVKTLEFASAIRVTVLVMFLLCLMSIMILDFSIYWKCGIGNEIAKEGFDN